MTRFSLLIGIVLAGCSGREQPQRTSPPVSRPMPDAAMVPSDAELAATDAPVAADAAPDAAPAADEKLAIQDLRAAAKKIAATWRKCESAGLSPFIDPAQPITLDESHCCYDKPGEGQRTTTVSGRGAARKLVPEKSCQSATRSTAVSDRIVCEGKCCNYEGDIHDGDWVTLLAVCFRATNGKLILERFVTGWGP